MTLAVPQRQFNKGIYVPIVTPFLDNEDLDLEALRRHVVRIGSAGAGIVVQGTTAEGEWQAVRALGGVTICRTDRHPSPLAAIHMTPAERVQVITTVRAALDEAGLSHIPIIAGCGTGSVRETIALTHDARKAGADAVMVIAPSFFGAKLKDDRVALKDFWW